VKREDEESVSTKTASRMLKVKPEASEEKGW